MKKNNQKKVFNKKELKELFEGMNLDTRKYRVEYLAEQLGFVQLEEGKGAATAALLAALGMGSVIGPTAADNHMKQVMPAIQQRISSDQDTHVRNFTDNQLKDMMNWEEEELKRQAEYQLDTTPGFVQDHARQILKDIEASGPEKFVMRATEPNPLYTYPFHGVRTTTWTVPEVVSPGEENPAGLISDTGFRNPHIPEHPITFKNTFGDITSANYANYVDGIKAEREKNFENDKLAARVGALSSGLGAGSVGGMLAAAGVGLAKDKELRDALADDAKKKNKTTSTNESYTTEQLREAFSRAGLDTKKFRVEYLAEQLGFVPLSESNRERAAIGALLGTILGGGIASGAVESILKPAEEKVEVTRSELQSDFDEKLPAILQWEEDKLRDDAAKIANSDPNEILGYSAQDRLDALNTIGAIDSSGPDNYVIKNANHFGSLLSPNQKLATRWTIPQVKSPGEESNPGVVHDNNPHMPRLNGGTKAMNRITSSLYSNHSSQNLKREAEKINSEVLANARTGAAIGGSALTLGGMGLGATAGALTGKKRIYESYTTEELREAFSKAGLDTRKFRVEYLAEQLGFRKI
jgi:hypothetical protein